MARTLSSLMRQAANAQETGEVVQTMLTIAHASIVGGPLRFVRDLQNFTSAGNVYTAVPFQIVLPEEDEDAQPRLRLQIDNIDRQIVQAVRSIPPSDAPTVQVDFALASQPDVIEASFAGFTLREVSYDLLVVEGALNQEEITLEPFPEGAFTPQYFAGLF